MSKIYVKRYRRFWIGHFNVKVGTETIDTKVGNFSSRKDKQESSEVRDSGTLRNQHMVHFEYIFREEVSQ